MIRLSQGLEISFAILNFIQSDDELNRSCVIYVYALQNGREQGLAYHLGDVYDKDGTFLPIPIDSSFTWCTYEHRNSDKIIINGTWGMHNMSGQIPYKSDNKHDYLHSFAYNQHYDAYLKLKEEILEFREKFLQSKEADESRKIAKRASK